MRNAIVRFAALYVFAVVILLLVGMLLPSVQVGWHALWAAVILTLAALLVKPTLTKIFRGAAAKSAGERTGVGEKVVQYVLVFAVELILWILTVILSGIQVRGSLWGYVLPPLLLLIGWVIYDAIDDRLEAKAGEVYDSVRGRRGGTGRPGASASATASAATTTTPAPAPEAPTTTAAREELADGLTPEQRRLLDEL